MVLFGLEEGSSEAVRNDKVSGGAVITLIGTVLTGCMGLATSVLLATTRNYLKLQDNATSLNQSDGLASSNRPFMPILSESAVASLVMVAAPNMLGSIIRDHSIPVALCLEEYSTRILHVCVMLISLLGILGLMLLSFFTQSMGRLGLGIYFAYLIFGAIGGIGLSVFSIGITTVAFWSPQQKQGTMNGIYGGATNVAPGLMGLWLGATMVRTSLGITYGIWLALLGVVILISTPMIYNSPYHQLMFRSTRTWALVYLYNVSFGGFLALTVFFPSFFKDAYNQSTETSAYLGSMFTIIAATYRVIAGFISDKINFMDGGIFMEGLSLLEMMIGSAMMVASDDFRLSICGTIIIALGIGGANAATYKILPKFSIASVAGTSGWVAGIGAFGGVVWPILMGGIKSVTGNSHSVFWLFMAISGLALIVLAGIFMVMSRQPQLICKRDASNTMCKVPSCKDNMNTQASK